MKDFKDGLLKILKKQIDSIISIKQENKKRERYITVLEEQRHFNQHFWGGGEGGEGGGG